MTRHGGGDKRSSWLTFQRCMVVMRRLMRGPATNAELIAEAEAELGSEAYPANANVALRQDIGRLRDDFGCTIRYRQSEGYRMTEPGFQALLDMPDQHIQTLAFLAAIFASGTLPHAADVASLIEHLLALLPEARRMELASQRDTLEYPASLGHTTADLHLRLRRVLGRHMLSFRYRSSFSGPEIEVPHQVAPVSFLYRDGHTYLYAFCHKSDGEDRRKYHHYRLDRIVASSLSVLPDRLPRDLPRPKQWLISYTLAPVVAHRRDHALWFGDSRVIPLEDGSAEVLARAEDLWQARQYLLGYREHCRVHEPPELVEMMRESIERMARAYGMEVSKYV